MNRTQRRQERRKKRPVKMVASSANSATSSGAYWKFVYVPPPETTFGPMPLLVMHDGYEAAKDE